MTVTEENIQEAIATGLRGLRDFSDADVVINDYSIMDGARAKAPFAILLTADDFALLPAPGTSRSMGAWTARVMLVIEFRDWRQAYTDLRDVRQRVATWLLETSAGLGLEGVHVTGVSSNTPIENVLHVGDDDPYNAVPVYLSQTLTVTVELF